MRTLKGLGHEMRIALKCNQWIGPGRQMEPLELIIELTFNFSCTQEVFMLAP
jgi:hypothetical protein